MNFYKNSKKILLIFDYKKFKQIKIKYFDLIIFRIMNLLKSNNINFDFIGNIEEIKQLNIKKYDLILSCLFLEKELKKYNIIDLKNFNFINNIYFDYNESNLLNVLYDSHFFNKDIFSYIYDESKFNVYINNPQILYSFNCNYNCSFCFFRKNNFFRNIDDLLNELDYIQNKYKNLSIELLSLDILYKYKNTISFLSNKIENKIDLPILSNLVLSNKISQDIIELFKDANLTRLKIGIESLNEITLKKMNKNIFYLEELYRLIDLFDDNFKIDFNFMVGFENDENNILKNLQEFQKFLKFFKKIISKISFYVYNQNNKYYIKELYDLIKICKNNNIEYQCHL